jgi:hypothetical protein
MLVCVRRYTCLRVEENTFSAFFLCVGWKPDILQYIEMKGVNPDSPRKRCAACRHEKQSK